MSKDKPLVSIVTPTKNRIEFTGNLLRNFYRQDYDIKRKEFVFGKRSTILNFGELQLQFGELKSAK